jgi:hypothetical protein
MKFISLGGNCSITYQLINYNLRTESYPFDWSKININQLLDVLTNNFDLYSDTIRLKCISEKHHLLGSNDMKPSLIFSNIYNIEFSHEINDLEKLYDFENSIKRRVIRFKNLTEKIIFIRIELSPIKTTYQDKIIKLLEQLNKYSSNYELRLIINTNIEFNFPNNVKIYKFNNFTNEWQMNHIDWNKIISE